MNCERCAFRNATGRSKFCGECNTIVDRILQRATRDGVTARDVGERFGLTHHAVNQRMARLRKHQQEAQ